MTRAVRGATTVNRNTREEIFGAVKELIGDMFIKNNIDRSDVISILFTATKDLDAVYPAAAVREMGYDDIPLLCSCELDIKGSLERCIRVMLFFNTEKNNKDIRHIYLRQAVSLRPDLTGEKNEKIQNSN
jgi:chorismate mutase